MTVNLVNNKDLFYQIPTTKEDKLWDEIIDRMNQYAPPEEVAGMTFHSRKVLSVSKPVRRNGEDNSNLNLTRATNPDRDNLNTIETRGLNVTCYPPKTLITNPEEPEPKWGEDLFGGYGRSSMFDELGISFWVYDRYLPSDEYGAMQSCPEDRAEDGGISDNGKVSSKPPTKEDYVSLSIVKMERHKWRELELLQWYQSIDHALSDKQVNAYISDAIRRKNAKGRMDWRDQKHVRQQAKTQKLGKLTPINTDGAEDGNRQRFERMMIPAMKAYVENHETQNLCLHNTKVSNHQDYDLANEKMVETIDNNLELVVKFVDAWRFFKIDPIKVTHRVSQKIGYDKEIGKIIPYPEKIKETE